MLIRSKAELHKYYSQNSTRERFNHFAQRRRLSVLRQMVQRFAPPNPLVLDIGCGDGWASGLALRGLTGVRYLGVEYSHDKIKDCRIHVDGEVSGILGDAEVLPIADITVDLVLFCETAEHLPFPHKALAEIKRILKPHGTMIMTVPLSGSLQEPLVRVYHMVRRKPEVFAEHLHFFTRSTVWDLVSDAGFEVEFELCHGFSLAGFRPSSYEVYEAIDRKLARIRLGLTGKPERWMIGHTFLALVCRSV